MTIIDELADAVVEGDEEKAVKLANKVIKQKINIKEAILNGLNAGMKIVGTKYENKEFFLPEIVVSSDAFYTAFKILQPHLLKNIEYKSSIIIGVVRGDVHDIGKNITKIFLEAAGYKVIDLGRNVPPEKFIDAIKKNQAEIVALSTMMTSTLENMRDVVKLIKKEGLRGKVKIILGGAAPDDKFAKEIGADFYAEDANAAVETLNRYILEVKSE
ncbi:MAG: cobalamin B12-binding domain-containing protein [Candidatus Helarchaeota archaeon]